jgi:serine/threonine protein kinase
MPLLLQVIDGADKGQAFRLPPTGTIRIGNSRKNTDICLHDLFVARVHCHVEVGAGKVTVSDEMKPNGILVNGAKVAHHELKPGDVVRIGNSYLRLEEAEDGAAAPPPAETEVPGKFCHLPLARMGELSGQDLGHFELGQVLARGHSGIAFRARDEKTEQTVALKVLAPVFPADEEEMKRFHKAMKARMAVPHAGLVPLRGAGKSGLYVWVATDLVEGESAATAIKHWNAARKVKWRGALRATLALARALEAIRAAHLVHANITPANVLLPDDGGGAKLNDLGLWDALAGSVLQQQTLEKKFLSELPYLSPEHVDPSAPVDDLSDQYSLGAVVYGLLTGRPPVEAGSPEETIQRVKTARPPRPKEFQRSIPDGFQAVVLRMLAKQPEERYPGPAAVVSDLAGLVAEMEEEE